MDAPMFLQLLKMIVVLVMVIAIANVSLKYANKYMVRSSKSIKIIERISVNSNSSLSLVKICDKYYLMSFTPTDNRILKELDQEELVNYFNELKEEKSSMDTNTDKKLFNLSRKAYKFFGERK